MSYEKRENLLGASVALIAFCLFIAALFYIDSDFGEISLSRDSSISGNISKPKVDAPSAKQNNTELIEKEGPVAPNKQSEAKSIHEEDVQNLITKWLNSWKSGDTETYRNCYASDFQSKGMNLDAWVSYKTNVYQKSKNVNISIDKLQISEEENNATAVFTQSYSSSILKHSGKKKLGLRKINDEWKIYRELM
jgi:ketosteroid isomerase-like protein